MTSNARRNLDNPHGSSLTEFYCVAPLDYNSFGRERLWSICVSIQSDRKNARETHEISVSLDQLLDISNGITKAIRAEFDAMKSRNDQLKGSLRQLFPKCYEGLTDEERNNYRSMF
jgi:hypothetical protein